MNESPNYTVINDTTNKNHMNPQKDFKKKIIFSVLLSIQVILAFIKLVLSIIWHHWFGLGSSIIVIILAAVGFYVLFKVEHKIVRGVYITLDILFVIWICVLLLVTLIGWDPYLSQFPAGCKKITNCSRLTTNTSTNVRTQGLSCPIINTTVNALHDETVNWINSFGNTGILLSDATFIHARFVSFLWGFADDFYVALECQGGSVAVWIQAEARLGTGDLGVNSARLLSFLGVINSTTFPAGSC